MVSKSKDDVVIVNAVRTPFGKYGGSLKDYDFYEFGAIPMREVLRRVNVPPETVGEVFWGVGDTSQCKDVWTPVAARQTLIKAGLPHTTPSIAFDKACVSAMSAVKLAAMTIRSGEIDTAIAGGCTLFSQEPLIVRGLRFGGYRLADVVMEDPMMHNGYKDFNLVSVDSDNVAYEYGVTRQDMDEWALRSHMNYGAAWKAGKFKEEIMPLTIPQPKGDPKVLDIDEQYRSDTTMERLGKLKPVFGTRAITAGNAPGLNDGATAILVMRRSKAEQMKLPVLATIIAQVSIAINASRMPEAPGFAIQKILKMASLTIDDIAAVEINEAFACVPLVSMIIVAEKDKAKFKKISDKTNINGSAIAVGHPNCSSGARLIMNLMYELKRRGGGYALAAICGGLAQSDATIIRVD